MALNPKKWSTVALNTGYLIAGSSFIALFTGPNPTRYSAEMVRGGQLTIATDADFTVTIGTGPENILHTGALTVPRAVTLSTTNAYKGARIRITRTGSGASGLDVGGLKTLATNTWAEVVYDGSAWYLAAYGAL